MKTGTKTIRAMLRNNTTKAPPRPHGGLLGSGSAGGAVGRSWPAIEYGSSRPGSVEASSLSTVARVYELCSSRANGKFTDVGNRSTGGIVDFQHGRTNSRSGQHNADDRFGVFNFAGSDHAQRLTKRHSNDFKDLVALELLFRLS